MNESIKKYFFRYLALTIANLMGAINFNLLIKPINLVAGGSPGLSIVFNKLFGFSTSDIITVIYVITFALSLIFLSKKTVIGIVYASIIYPLFIYLTENITDLILFNYNDKFLIVIVAAIITGINNGIVYKNGFASSGIGIIPVIFNKYFKVSISVANFIINSIIVLIGGYFFGFNTILYAIVYLYISNYICNMVILGVASCKTLFIHSDKKKEIIDFLHNKYGLTAVMLHHKNDKNLMVVVLKSSDYVMVRNDLKKIDNNIFFTTNNCYEVKNK